MRDTVVAMRGRYEELERRRRLEAEGFRSDVRLLRQDVRALERRLAKVTGQFFGDVEQQANREVSVVDTKMMRMLHVQKSY